MMNSTVQVQSCGAFEMYLGFPRRRDASEFPMSVLHLSASNQDTLHLLRFGPPKSKVIFVASICTVRVQVRDLRLCRSLLTEGMSIESLG